MDESQRCMEVRVLVPELALGVASGEVRARALAHIAGCDECRRELEDAAATVDELLLLAPEHEPPPGFDTRVLTGLDHRSRRPSTSRLLLAAAALVLVAGAAGGLTWWRGSDDRTLASQYRETLSVAGGRYLHAADLISTDGGEVGHVFAYQGSPPWIFVSVQDGPPGVHRVRLVTTAGRTVWIGTCSVRDDGTGSWGTSLGVPISAVERVDLVRNGQATMVAKLG